VECQMHYTLDVCAVSGMLATQYCPAHATKGVVILPIGHPLYDHTSGQYASVLSDYLGEYAALRLTADPAANEAMLRGRTCPIHQNAYSYDQNLVENQLLPDARRLLSQAESQLANLPLGNPGYYALLQAISDLNTLIYNNPSSADLAAAMTALTRAMAAAQ